jgi:hypothetical protein
MEIEIKRVEREKFRIFEFGAVEKHMCARELYSKLVPKKMGRRGKGKEEGSHKIIGPKPSPQAIA